MSESLPKAKLRIFVRDGFLLIEDEIDKEYEHKGMTLVHLKKTNLVVNKEVLISP